MSAHEECGGVGVVAKGAWLLRGVAHGEWVYPAGPIRIDFTMAESWQNHFVSVWGM